MKRLSYILILLTLNIFNLEVSAKENTKDDFAKKSSEAKITGVLSKSTSSLTKESATEQAKVIKIAEAHLEKVYGKKVLEQRPWIVEEKADKFFIKGTFHKQGKGGVAEIEISKKDHKVIRYTHGK